MTGWFAAWFVATHFVAFAFYLKVTRVAYGWSRTIAAYVAGYLLPFAACLLFASPEMTIPRLYGGEQARSGSFALGVALLYSAWSFVAVVMSRGAYGRRLFAVLVCGVHQMGALILSLLFLHRLSATGGVIAVGVMVGMGALLLLIGLPSVLKMDESAAWRPLNLTAGMNFVLLFATGCWPTYVPAGSWQDLTVFIVANVVAIVYFPVCYASSETNRMKRTIGRIGDNTRVLLAELRSAREVGEGARRIRHDTRHHIHEVIALLEAGRSAEALGYVRGLESNDLLGPVACRQWCGNEYVNGLLNLSAARARERGFAFAADVRIGGTLPLANEDLVALVGNLLENAVRHSSGDVKVRLAVERGTLQFGVSNRVPDGFRLVRKLPCEEPGVGIQSIQSVIARYGGHFAYELDAGVLTALVFIGGGSCA